MTSKACDTINCEPDRAAYCSLFVASLSGFMLSVAPAEASTGSAVSAANTGQFYGSAAILPHTKSCLTLTRDETKC